MESSYLFDQLLNHDDETEIHRLLVRLIHASFEDDQTTVSYFLGPNVGYNEEWVDAGAFAIDDYVIEETSPGEWRVRLNSSYRDTVKHMQPDESVELVDGKVIYQLDVKCNEYFHTGQGRISVIECN